MDRITKSLFDKFISQNRLGNLNETTAFEYFVGYITAGIHFQETFDLEDIITGSSGDCGIDSIAILVNGSIVSEPEEIDDFVTSSTYLDIDFVMTQSEISPNFDSQKIGQFCFGVKDIFQITSTLPQNDAIKLKKKIIDKIYENSSKFKNRNPNLYLYYATTGKWVNDTNLSSRADNEKETLSVLNMFKKIDFIFLDASRIQNLYRKTSTGTNQEITIDKYIPLPNLMNIDQSFFTYINSNEFIKLLTNDDGSINQSIFYDNIRDWQEINPVNKEIAETINNASSRKYFHLLNNGITIVADKIQLTGSKFSLENYQVVNGCQTSYAIYNNKDKIDSPIVIPVRLIATTDRDIKNKIIKATNRQIPITDDMLYALSELPKKLEMFFDSYEDERKLYFERRPKQYAQNDNIEKSKVINFQNLVRSFSSAFLDIPHQTTKNYKLLLKTHNKKILAEDNVLEMYYLSALLNYKVEYILKTKFNDNKYRPVKWHIIMGYIKYTCIGKLPRFNSNKMQRLCDERITEVFDENIFSQKIDTVFGIIKEVANDDWQRDSIRTEVFTNNVINKINAIRETP